MKKAKVGVLPDPCNDIAKHPFLTGDELYYQVVTYGLGHAELLRRLRQFDAISRQMDLFPIRDNAS